MSNPTILQLWTIIPSYSMSNSAELGSPLSTIRILSNNLCFVLTRNVSTYDTLPTAFEATLRGATTKKTMSRFDEHTQYGRLRTIRLYSNMAKAASWVHA